MIAVAVAAILVPVAFAQEPPARDSVRRDDAVRIFLDCQAHGCDTDYLRTQITFVNYVRFREDAEVYILITGQQTGSGGSSATLFFMGQGVNAGRADTLRFASSGTATSDEVRTGLARTLKIGLMRYVAGTPVAARIGITYTPADSAAGSPQRPHDPWNSWVFNISANGYVQGESKQSFRNLYSYASANRVTEQWRIGLSTYYDDSRDEFTYTLYDSTGAAIKDTTVTGNQHSNGAEGLIARSLGGHWALGGTASYNKSTYSNIKNQFRFGPILEFDVFPYSEFTRRRLVFNYSIGVARRVYAESTEYFKTEETLFNHALDISLGVQQPCCNAGVSLRASQYLHDLSKNRIRFSGNIRVRLIRGLSVRVSGSYSRIRDQLELAGAGEDPTDVLLRRIQRATNYRYNASFGLTYTFGSTYNNVVNPRLESSGGDCCD